MKKKTITVCLGIAMVIGVSLGAVQLTTNAEHVSPSINNDLLTTSNFQKLIGQKTIALSPQLTVQKSAEDVRVYEVGSELVSLENEKTLSKQLIIYEDIQKNQYIFSPETGFIGYSTNEYVNYLPVNSSNHPSQRSILSKDNASLKNIQALIRDTLPISNLIPEFERYQMLDINDDYGLDITLQKEISPDLKDQIFISIASDGSIQHIGTYQTNLTEITAAQKTAFEHKWEEYLKKLQFQYDRYNIDAIVYKKVGNQILADYSVVFYTKTDAEDMKLGDLVTLAIDA